MMGGKGKGDGARRGEARQINQGRRWGYGQEQVGEIGTTGASTDHQVREVEVDASSLPRKEKRKETHRQTLDDQGCGEGMSRGESKRKDGTRKEERGVRSVLSLTSAVKSSPATRARAASLGLLCAYTRIQRPPVLARPSAFLLFIFRLQYVEFDKSFE